MKCAITTTDYDGCDYSDVVSLIDDFCALDPDPKGAALAVLASLQRDGIAYATAVVDDVGLYPVRIEYGYEKLIAVRNSGQSASTLAVYGTGEDGGAVVQTQTVAYRK